MLSLTVQVDVSPKPSQGSDFVRNDAGSGLVIHLQGTVEHASDATISKIAFVEIVVTASVKSDSIIRREPVVEVRLKSKLTSSLFHISCLLHLGAPGLFEIFGFFELRGHDGIQWSVGAPKQLLTVCRV
jgi:hypothetical protein